MDTRLKSSTSRYLSLNRPIKKPAKSTFSLAECCCFAEYFRRRKNIQSKEKLSESMDQLRYKYRKQLAQLERERKWLGPDIQTFESDSQSMRRVR